MSFSRNLSSHRRTLWTLTRVCDSFLIYSFYFLNPFADARASSLPVRLLPFSTVPGIIINSRHFLKAVSLIAKQCEAPGPATVTPVVDYPVDSASTSKGKKKHNSGMFFTLIPLHFLIILILQIRWPSFSTAPTRISSIAPVMS